MVSWKVAANAAVIYPCEAPDPVWERPSITKNVENLILERLKRFQMSHDRIEAKLGEVVTRIGNLEPSVAGLRRDFSHSKEDSASISVRMDRLNDRLERVERRLDLNA